MAKTWKPICAVLRKCLEEVYRLTFDEKSAFRIYCHKNNRQRTDGRLFFMQMHLSGLYSLDSEGWGATHSRRGNPNYKMIAEATAMEVCDDLRKNWIATGKSKSGQPKPSPIGLQGYILVPLQMPRDSVILHHSPVTVEEFVLRVAEWAKRTQTLCVLKAHPGCRRDTHGETWAAIDRATEANRWGILRQDNIHSLIANAAGLFTINSGTGFEAIVHGKPVVVFGEADYDHVTGRGSLDDLDAAREYLLRSNGAVEAWKFATHYLFQHCYWLSADKLAEARIGNYLAERISAWNGEIAASPASREASVDWRALPHVAIEARGSSLVDSSSRRRRMVMKPQAFPSLKVAYVTHKLSDGGGVRNIGDRVIYEGVRNLLRMAIGPHMETISHFGSADSLPSGVDLIVTCGTPQISQGSTIGPVLRRILDVASSEVPVKLNLGAGSFYFDGFGKDRAKSDAEFSERVRVAPVADAYREFAKFDLCTCRDLGAVATLRGLGVEAIGLPCPGFFAAIFQPRPLFRRQEELVSVLNGTASFWNRVDADVHGFYRRLWESDPTRIFLAHDEQDCEMLSDMGIPHVVFESVEQFLAYLAGFEQLLSVRVHGALPAWTLGLDVTLLGIDRRALIGEDFGARFRVIPLREEKDFAVAEAAPEADFPMQSDEDRRAWLWDYAGEYVRRIREVVSRKLGCEFPDDMPFDPAPEGGAPTPTISRPPGRYFSKYFYSDESAFAIEPKLFRSAHRVEYLDDALNIETTSDNKTLLYGPYVRIPKGKWKVTGKVGISAEAGASQVEHKITVRVVKGIPARELGTCECVVASDREGERGLELAFQNQNDTGLIETLLVSGAPMPVGTRLRVCSIGMQRLD